MIRGLGTDIIEISRIRDVYKRRGQKFLDRIYTSKEQAYCQEMSDPVPRLAGRFAAKEALVKALGTGMGPYTWTDFEILPNSDGKPEVHFRDKRFLLSISHSRDYAMATAILLD